jgi:hypothetical protein
MVFTDDDHLIIVGDFIEYNGVGRNRVASVNLGELVTQLDAAVPDNQPLAYPNPTQGLVWIDQLAHGKPTAIAVRNAQGQLVFEGTVRYKVDLSGLPDGAYSLSSRALDWRATIVKQ